MSKRIIVLSATLLLAVGILTYGGYRLGASNPKPIPVQSKSQVSQGTDWRWGNDSGHNFDCSTVREDRSNVYSNWAYKQNCPSQSLPQQQIQPVQPTYPPPQSNYFSCSSYTYGMDDRFISTSCY